MAENMDNGGRLIPYEYSGKGQEELNYNSSDSESSSSSSSDEDAYEYTQRKEKFYRELFNIPLKKIRFGVHSKDRATGSSHSFTLDLEERNIGLFNQVVGFNVISASVPRAYYTINTGNQILGGAGTIPVGIYTPSELATQITALGSTTTYSDKTGKFTFGSAVSVTTNNTSLAKILGINANGENHSVSEYHIDIRGTSCIDIELEEIPPICCIQTDHSNNIVARIPVDSSQGDILTYHSQSTDISTNHFFPIKLSKLTVNLLDESGSLLHLNGIDFHMICEATVLGDLPEDF
jgi:hypothetical protein